MSVSDIIDEMEMNMMDGLEAMKRDFSAIRTGKASPALVENILVDYYGAKTPIKNMAGISTPETRLLVIQPWDQSAVKNIEKAIVDSQLGISPVSDGRVIRLPIPPLTQERRQTLAKQVKTRGEDGKVQMRNARRDANEAVKKAQKASEISEDEMKDALDKIQKKTDDYITQIDAAIADKDKELMAF